MVDRCDIKYPADILAKVQSCRYRENTHIKPSLAGSQTFLQKYAFFHVKPKVSFHLENDAELVQCFQFLCFHVKKVGGCKRN